MIKENVVHTYAGILLSNKNKEISDVFNNLDGSAKNYAE